MQIKFRMLLSMNVQNRNLKVLWSRATIMDNGDSIPVGKKLQPMWGFGRNGINKLSKMRFRSLDIDLSGSTALVGMQVD